MNDRVIVIITIILLLFVTSSALLLFLQGPDTMADIRIVSVSTDKPIYHSKETMHLAIEIKSSQSVNDLTLTVIGIRDITGQPRLHQDHQVNLNQGVTSIPINYTLPVCSRCAGLPPGTYNITITIGKDSRILAESIHQISIE